MANPSSSLQSPASGLNVTVVTPEETVVETTASSIVLPLFDGEVGILPKHAPMIGRLGYGEMRITTGGEVESLYVDGGFVQVADNEVNVMTSRSMPLHKLDHEAAEKSLAESLNLASHGEEGIAARQKAVDQARAQIRLAKKRAK